MKTHEACISALNDLIKINNDRIEGYQKAVDELKDSEDFDLKALFVRMGMESEQHRVELADMVLSYGGEATDGSMVTGKLYRAWMDVKALFTGSDRETILNSCEGGEDAAQKAYQMALDDEDVMPETKQLIAKQKSSLKESHDEIKALRDAVAN
ncbi:ferritin-like domain-containing protein [Niabella ginsengisoli]|uniref:PA2169 family four-helix-bundle protein n=1 Tax=Niabella ginsengisoli TaxID=522298 RepID=A0ABS9SN08_9BACT|nr:PA2169 family four-helix-bundle protein [Niabella ginsengisoli]MCH5599783.1 PA2169 family four-helix-bundle protein [Niabella ginsengisoli]